MELFRRGLECGLVLFFLFAVPLVSHSAGNAALATAPYVWTSQAIKGALWGLAYGDVDGNGSTETLLVERRRILVGVFENDRFKPMATCDMPGQAEAARVDTLDVTGDGIPEIIVTAVEGGLTAGAIFAMTGNACRALAHHIRFSMRVMTLPEDGKEHLLGQSWSSQRYFSGPVAELVVVGGTVSEKRRMVWPRYADIYDMTPFVSGDGVQKMAIVEGWNPLDIRAMDGKKYKKEWRSPERVGGTANLLDASQRPLLDEKSSDTVGFDIPPLVLGERVAVVREDLPLKNVIGKRPYIRGSEVILYEPDPAFGWKEVWRSGPISGAAMDLRVDTGAPMGAKRVAVLLQRSTEMWEAAQASSIVAYDLP